MNREELLSQINEWHEVNEHQKIIDAIEALPHDEWGYELTCLLARAYNNVSSEPCDWQRHLGKAVSLLESVREDGKDDALWHFRLGYALYFLDREEEALPCFRRAAELDPNDSEALYFIGECEKALASKVVMYTEDELDIVEKHIGKYFGEFENVFHEIISPDIHVDICVIPPREKRNFYTLVTMGMGARKMNVPEELAKYKLERAELAIALPPDWKLDKESLQDEKWYWPIRLLKSTARLPIQDDTWLGWGHTVGMGEGETYAENTTLCGCLLIDPKTSEDGRVIGELPNGDPVNFYQLIPLYQDEMSYKIEYGSDALLEKLSGVVSYVVEPCRSSALETEDSLMDNKTKKAELPKLAEAFMSYLGCECEYFPPVSDDDPIMAAYNNACRLAPKEGYVPVLIAVDETLWECLILNSDPDNDGAEGYGFDPKAVAAYREKQLSQPVSDGKTILNGLIGDRKEEAEDDDMDWEELLGEMSGEEDEDQGQLLSFWNDSTHKTYPLILAKIPVKNPWEVFAYLPFGNWNECPDTPALVAVAKHWYEQYGAVPAAMTHDELEFLVADPVDEERAMELALEQYGFCPDIIYQAEEDVSVGTLADHLHSCNVWYFWWD